MPAWTEAANPPGVAWPAMPGCASSAGGAARAVVRELGGGAGHVRQQAGEPGVQAGPFARHQVGVDRLAQQRVPETVPVRLIECQQVVARRLADGLLVDV